MSRRRTTLKHRRFTQAIDALSPKVKKFVRALAKTGDIQKANIAAYGDQSLPSEREDTGRDLLKKPAVREALIRIWDEQGFTLAKMARIHHKLAESADKDSVKLEAVKTGYEVHGVLEKKKDSSENGDTYNFIHLFIKQREDRGLPIPAEVLEVKSQMEALR